MGKRPVIDCYYKLSKGGKRLIVRLNGAPPKWELDISRYPDYVSPQAVEFAKQHCGNLPYELCNAKLIFKGMTAGLDFNDPREFIDAVSMVALKKIITGGGIYLHAVARDTAVWWAQSGIKAALLGG
jgi:hypothetical protein